MGLVRESGLRQLLEAIHLERGLDFTQYKDGTLIRRIGSRMRTCGVSSYEDYISYLRKEPKEYDELINTVTINVTEFFRNPEVFDGIGRIVIPQIVAKKKNDHSKVIRAWCCGCSSGDEPYSVAILFLEKVSGIGSDISLSIIGTDIDYEALAEATEMHYNVSRLKTVNSKWLKKYFDENDDNTYTLKDSVRSLVKFRRHDVVKDPGIARCDLVLCRNLLIYFKKELQEEMLMKFYDALNPGGYLVLGMVESLTGTACNVFEHVDSRLRIYRKPEETLFKFEKDKLLTQDDIDGIVSKMLEKE